MFFVFSWLGKIRGNGFGAGYWDGVFSYSPGSGAVLFLILPARESRGAGRCAWLL